MMKKNRALFLDRDGILIEDTGYPHKPQDITFIDDAVALCRAAQDKGYLNIVVTNQSGIARGMFSEHEVVVLHEWMQNELAEQGVTITRFYVCPYHVDAAVQRYRRNSPDRKPNPGMVQKAQQEYDIDIAGSLMVGDKPSDRIRLAKLRTVVVKSKYTGDEYDVESIPEVIKYL
ncbi:MAG: HAD-IIIA family hydrolase [Chitinivibrionales bacterium]|nr:HAD-IIIA family hydrolase [Chitinivibrionales bacterium]